MSYAKQYQNRLEAAQQGGVENYKAAKLMSESRGLVTKKTQDKLRDIGENREEMLDKILNQKFKSANDDVKTAEEDIQKYLASLDKDVETPVEKPSTGLMAKTSGGTDIADFIAEQEQFRATPYWDEKQYTNGYGTKAKSKDEVITEEEARKRLNQQVEVARKAVKRLEEKYDEPFTEGQTKALISFTYNTGQGNLMKLADKGNRGISEIGDMLTEYVYAGKKKLPGLVKRRELEYQIFNEGN